MSQPYSHVASTMQSLIETGARKAVKFVTPTYTVKVTRQRKLDRRDKSETFLVTTGKPNYLERKFIKLAVRAREPFPIKKIQLKFFKAA